MTEVAAAPKARILPILKNKDTLLNNISETLYNKVPPMPDEVIFKFLPDKFFRKKHITSKSGQLDAESTSREMTFISARSIPGREQIWDEGEGTFKVVVNATTINPLTNLTDEVAIEFERNVGSITLRKRNRRDMVTYYFMMLNPRNVDNVLGYKDGTVVPELYMINESAEKDKAADNGELKANAYGLIAETLDLDLLSAIAGDLQYAGSPSLKHIKAFLYSIADATPDQIVSAFNDQDTVRLRGMVADALELGVITERVSDGQYVITGSTKGLAKFNEKETGRKRQRALVQFFMSENGQSDLARVEKLLAQTKAARGDSALGVSSDQIDDALPQRGGKKGKLKAEAEPVVEAETEEPLIDPADEEGDPE